MARRFAKVSEEEIEAYSSLNDLEPWNNLQCEFVLKT